MALCNIIHYSASVYICIHRQRWHLTNCVFSENRASKKRLWHILLFSPCNKTISPRKANLGISVTFHFEPETTDNHDLLSFVSLRDFLHNKTKGSMGCRSIFIEIGCVCH